MNKILHANKFNFSNIKPSSWMIVSAILVSFQALFFNTLDSIMAAPSIMLTRYIIPCMLLWTFYLIKPHPLWKTKDTFILIVRACCITISQCCLCIYLTKASLLNATTLYLTSPIWTPIINAIIQKNNVKPISLALATLGFIGVCVLQQNTPDQVNRYLLIGVGSGLFNSISQIANHKASQSMTIRANTLGTYSYTVLTGIFAFCILHNIIQNHHSGTYSASTHNIIGILIALAIIGILNQTCRSRAYSLVTDTTNITTLLYLSIPVSAIIGYIHFEQHINLCSVAGSCLILISCYISTRLEKTESGLNTDHFIKQPYVFY